ncbi:CRISPR-associated Cas1 family protein [Brevibacterium sanguinis]|uniref:CRISPR-associated endonuclease Cas1 n=2 Tax=Brevibacterium TaxID=1696 RepID=A0A366IJA6_9MICO|nr:MULTISPECIES: type I-E CRISPR-associated endonuclease Cas1e [Brevibacterium]RBP65570.1 CRISPR-associated Cas1 family protein [Brevibacterium sanguinis]RBP72204.1 CRISPR-associated Cas1 family protein [Brevibacterium celere]
MRDRLSFLYVERATIARDRNALTIRTDEGITYVPGAGLACLMAGPGSRITHQGMSLLGECGVSTVWVGEKGIRYYAHGRSLASSTRYLVRQAELVSNVRSRVAVARAMYAQRFPGEDVSGLSMQQLRGREGARVRQIYRAESQRSGVPWTHRNFDFDDFDASDEINRALSAAHVCLYGIVHAVVAALGASPGLGFVHNGHERAFVYDIADLYKADITIPLAFDVTAESPPDIGAAVRYRVRDLVYESRVVDRTIDDVTRLLFEPAEVESALDSLGLDSNVVQLWDPKGLVEGGTNYHVDS